MFSHTSCKSNGVRLQQTYLGLFDPGWVKFLDSALILCIFPHNGTEPAFYSRMDRGKKESQQRKYRHSFVLDRQVSINDPPQ